MIPDNTCILRLTAAAGTELADAYSSDTVINSSPKKEVYNPQAFFPHAVWLDQACAHCLRFPTAASRRSLGRVSVPVWLIILSNQLWIVGLVGHYPTNYLIQRGPIQRRNSFPRRAYTVLAVISNCCSVPLGMFPRVTHPSAAIPEGIARLACVRPAASVRSEPGSNSQV